MRTLLIPVGSYGDVNPFLGLGRELRRRGHEVLVATNDHFAPLVRHDELEFISLGTEAEYDEVLKEADAWHPTKGLGVIARFLEPFVRRVYEVVVRHYRPGETVVAAGTLAFAARVAQEKLGTPLVSIHLQPSIFRSLYQTPRYPRLKLPDWLPRAIKRGFFWIADRYVIDPLYAPSINVLRAELGLPPVHGVLKDWCHSPQRVLGLFPDWFGPPQPDWPPQTRLSGFPLQDGRTEEELSGDVKSFLEAGEPPIVFTPGSAMRHGLGFFTECLEVCRLLGRRGIFVSKYRENIPDRLPDSVRHFSYVPYGQLLPHAAAAVHHGGIGTSSQALAAGVPQLVMPFTHDQPDNAERLEGLGVARVLDATRYRAAPAAQLLDELLRSPDVARQCKIYEERLAQARPLEEAAGFIEALAGSDA